MAIITGDGIWGVMGDGVFYNRNGKKILRAKPSHYTDAKTPAQLYNRERLKLTSRFISSVKPFIKLGYQATEISIYDNYSNEARQFIIKNCFIRVNDHPQLNYGQIKISRGEIPSPEDYSMTITESFSGTFSQKIASVSWKKPESHESMLNPADKVMICMFADSGSDGQAWLYKNMADRKDGSFFVPIPKSDMPVYIWMFFHNGDAAEGESKRKISDSVYLGKVLP